MLVIFVTAAGEDLSYAEKFLLVLDTVVVVNYGDMKQLNTWCLQQCNSLKLLQATILPARHVSFEALDTVLTDLERYSAITAAWSYCQWNACNSLNRRQGFFLCGMRSLERWTLFWRIWKDIQQLRQHEATDNKMLATVFIADRDSSCAACVLRSALSFSSKSTRS